MILVLTAICIANVCTAQQPEQIPMQNIDACNKAAEARNALEPRSTGIKWICAYTSPPMAPFKDH